jgi:hypothetical protein
VSEVGGARQTQACRVAFGVADLALASLGYLAIFCGLPARYWLVDGSAVVLIALFAGTGAALLANHRWARPLARAASLLALVVGLSLVAATALAANYLAAINGPVGRGGALLELLCAALAFPYLVVFPALQLIWAWPSDR